MHVQVIRAAAALGLVLVVGVANADEKTDDEARAQTLFDEGLALANAGKWAQACPKFEASERLAPTNGTLLNLGICHAHIGKTATAYGELLTALTAAKKEGRADRAALATENIAALEPKLSKITIVVSGAADTLQVKLDGRVLERGALGTALPVDPGVHLVEAVEDGTTRWSATVDVGAVGDRKRVEIPSLSGATQSVSVVPAAAPAESRPTRTIVAWSLVGAGVTSLVVGGWFVHHAYSKHGDASRANDASDPAASGLQDDANRALNVGRVALGVGVLAAGTGAVLFLTAPRSTPASIGVAPAITATGLGVSMRASW